MAEIQAPAAEQLSATFRQFDATGSGLLARDAIERVLRHLDWPEHKLQALMKTWANAAGEAAFAVASEGISERQEESIRYDDFAAWVVDGVVPPPPPPTRTAEECELMMSLQRSLSQGPNVFDVFAAAAAAASSSSLPNGHDASQVPRIQKVECEEEMLRTALLDAGVQDGGGSAAAPEDIQGLAGSEEELLTTIQLRRSQSVALPPSADSVAAATAAKSTPLCKASLFEEVLADADKGAIEDCPTEPPTRMPSFDNLEDAL
eukprot:TRINITY_DN26829_c0_g1_i1.p1 TRINITY_DN26829_c0_g1~~TRINITY_DN26829_c0_g1_i1.p1  ORF type:complete len:290 (+),score=74.49 TRINITY_DN26829_c0_g1_i1:86-871(+)